jgi:hypothetical protein
LLGSFVSRNNDVGGYWALGRLYRLALAANAQSVCVDLLKATVTPPDARFADMVVRFRQKLANQLAVHGLPAHSITAATVRVEFSRVKSPDRPGDVFNCTVLITDDRGRTRVAGIGGACWAHNPFRESRRRMPPTQVR